MTKIKTALLSYGMSGKVFHAPFLQLHPGFELVGAWERSKKLVKEELGIKSYGSLEELLEDDVSLVVVNTPVETHYEYAKQALLAGKHTLVEKAFTTTSAEAEDLNAIAQQMGVKIAVFQNRRWDSDFKTVKQVVREGLLGDIVEAEFRFDRYNPNLSPKAHKESNNPGAGLLKDLGPHLIDQAVHLFGYPEAVFSDLRVIREHSQVDDGLDILLYYPKMRVRLRSGFFFRESVPAYALHGRKGSFLKSRGDVQEDDLKAGRKPGSEGWGTEPAEKSGLLHTEKNGDVFRGHIPTRQGDYDEFYNLLHEAITSDKEVPVTANDGIRVMKIIEATIESSRDKKRVELK
jgi:scyllo-inositol 2-dehydrogenase (NADP+)